MPHRSRPLARLLYLASAYAQTVAAIAPPSAQSMTVDWGAGIFKHQDGAAGAISITLDTCLLRANACLEQWEAVYWNPVPRYCCDC